MVDDKEGLTLPYEYEERATNFVEAVKKQMFPDLEKEGFSCYAFTLSGVEDDEELWDDTEADKEARRVLAEAEDRFDRQLTEAGVDRGELLVTGSIDKKAFLEGYREKLEILARGFGGREHKWFLDEKQSKNRRLAELVLLASYEFRG